MSLLHLMLLALPIIGVLGNGNIHSDAVHQIAESNTRFAIDLYKEIIKDPKVDNVIFSPVSVSSALAMTRFGCEGNSSAQIGDALHLGNIEPSMVNFAFGELNGLLFDKPGSNVTLTSANGAFIHKSAKVLDSYKKALSAFGADVKETDFSDSKGATESINQWISEHTDGLIKDMMDESGVNALTKLILTSTIYFSGDWHSGFNPTVTMERPFHVSHYRVIQTSFMYQKGKFRFAYIEPLALQVLEMPYVNQEISMIVLLPDNFDLESVEENLNHKNLTNWLSQLKYDTVDITFPKFTLEESLQLHETLSNLGVTDVFKQGKADLSGITGDKSLYVDEIMHKGVLEVAQTGGKVVAERAEAKQTPINKTKLVYADHPFIFLVRNIRTDTVYLFGAFKRPNGQEVHHDEL